MARGIQFQGRLSRRDKRPANPGRYDLFFSLHPDPDSNRVLWSETIRGVEVMPGGFYYVVLGLKQPLNADLFSDGPRFMAVQVLRKGRPEGEHGARVPLLANELRLAERLGRCEEALARATELQVKPSDETHDEILDKLPRLLSHLTERVEELRTRVDALANAEHTTQVETRLAHLERRITELDADGGRLDRIEDELEDLVGPDGDVVDLNERMDRIEGRAPELIEALRKREAQAAAAPPPSLTTRVDQIQAGLASLRTDVETIESAIAELRATPAPTADDLGAVKRRGDVMTGKLTINRGGLEVLSGGVTCRGANVNTLNASNLVRAPKLIADALELRGDLTVDNTHRALQARLVEGRQGSSRKDGPLHLNSRGGAEVVVGNATERNGIEVFGTARSDGVISRSTGIAELFEAAGAPKPGEVVRIDGHRVRRTDRAGDPTVAGIVTDKPGVLLGGPPSESQVAVAVHGVVSCRVEADSAPIAPGDLLMSSDLAGFARKVDDVGARVGCIIAKALEPLDSGRGTIRVLVLNG